MSLRTFPMYIIDAFTKRPLSGNPAAVCLIPPGIEISDDEKQKIASEMNLSETSFVKTLTKDVTFTSGSQFSLRWFTPTTEVNLCGHATLASAAALLDAAGNESAKIDFETKSGTLSVMRHPNKPGFLAMDFPNNAPNPQDSSKVKQLLNACVDEADWIEDVQYSPTTKKLLVRLKDNIHRSALEGLKPKANALLEAESTGLVKGVGVTLKGSSSNGCVDEEGNVYDFVSRYFAPWLGIAEDPVTGSWHTVAGPYWAKQLAKNDLYARQCSARGGDLWVEVKESRVTLMGQAVINLKGTFQL